MEYEKDRRNPSVLNRAVGESRTHTGLRPLPPQSSVYTIAAKKAGLVKDAADKAKVALEAEKKVNAERAEALAKKAEELAEAQRKAAEEAAAAKAAEEAAAAEAAPEAPAEA